MTATVGCSAASQYLRLDCGHPITIDLLYGCFSCVNGVGFADDGTTFCFADWDTGDWFYPKDGSR